MCQPEDRKMNATVPALRAKRRQFSNETCVTRLWQRRCRKAGRTLNPGLGMARLVTLTPGVTKKEEI